MRNKPPRTLGISLAILASAMLFSILPLLQIAMVLIIRYHMQQIDLPVPGQSNSIAPLAVGGDFTGVNDSALFAQGLMGVVYLIIAFFAWRGRPTWIRFATLAAVLVLTLVTIGFSVSSLLASPDLSGGIDSGSALVQTLLSGRLLLSVLVALYVVWYMNRGPARAYYRGSYMTEPNKVVSQAS